jgi:cytochrome c oxidase cbb3-type subunit 2
MKASLRIFLGALLAFAVSWGGLVLAPFWQMGGQLPAPGRLPTPDYPAARPGLAQQGSEVYRSLGCAECHTQQVRPQSTDQSRGWGKRRTVARDFLFDQPVMAGRLRIGPDLANLGSRLPAQYAASWQLQVNTNWVEETTEKLLLHLYNPRQTAPTSIMPSFRFLFEAREITPARLPAPESIALAHAAGLPAGHSLSPKPEARALVAYLLSLRAETPLFEAPTP